MNFGIDRNQIRNGIPKHVVQSLKRCSHILYLSIFENSEIDKPDDISSYSQTSPHPTDLNFKRNK